MLYRTKIKKVSSIKEFLTADQPKEITRAHPLRLYGITGIDITHSDIWGAPFNEPFFVVFGVFAVAIFSIAGEYFFRSTGNEIVADAIAMTTKLLFPMAFYLFLYFGIIHTF